MYEKNPLYSIYIYIHTHTHFLDIPAGFNPSRNVTAGRFLVLQKLLAGGLENDPLFFHHMFRIWQIDGRLVFQIIQFSSASPILSRGHLGNSSWVSSSPEALLNSQMTTSRITFRYFWYVLHMLNHIYHILCT